MKFTPILLLLISFSMMRQTPTISSNDLQEIAGQWTGTLSYTDYKDDATTYTLKCQMTTTWKGNTGLFKLGFTEPNGTMVYDKVKLKRLKQGQMVKFDGQKYLVEQFTKEESPGHWNLVMSCTGKDNNRNANIKQFMSITKTSLSVRKEVNYEGTANFFTRNEYAFERE